MIYGDRAIDHGQDAYESAWAQAEREVVSAYWDDPLGLIVEYFDDNPTQVVSDDLKAALAPNDKCDRREAEASGLALARVIRAARSAWVERRRDEILDKAGA